eukprot:364343-Chlamydomonas_euryale.AAC.3
MTVATEAGGAAATAVCRRCVVAGRPLNSALLQVKSSLAEIGVPAEACRPWLGRSCANGLGRGGLTAFRSPQPARLGATSAWR